MAIANLHETLLSYSLRKAQLQEDLSVLKNQKTLAMYQQGDATTLENAQKAELRQKYKDIYNADQKDRGAHIYDDYRDYTEIPEFEEELNKIVAQYQEQIDELAAWETIIDAQITTNSAELEEVNAYMESLKSMLSSNIQEDFKYGLNG